MGDSMEEELKIVDKFFRFREEKFMEKITENLDALNQLENNKINVKRKQISEIVNRIPEENKKVKEEILNGIDSIIADYNIAIAHNNKKYYRQGFLDSMQIRDVK